MSTEEKKRRETGKKDREKGKKETWNRLIIFRGYRGSNRVDSTTVELVLDSKFFMQSHFS